ncbi:hypothetical protein [Gordonia aichiensis]|uniref:Uncharacterized protein n=1 Tax=Gordonia aichiensis NBRC 108223 TaxID=1220583 RepID=L7KIF6_9ACTN|nr:hypothetical protein [Gordonia aichiensis]GAC47747.1 hypothetical protein GOACH_04_01430 [Gordonia aichiensis NBRC 108223]
MSDFIKKIKDDAKAVGAAIDNELTVLEGVPGYDPLADEDADKQQAAADESGDAGTQDDAADESGVGEKS